MDHQTPSQTQEVASTKNFPIGVVAAAVVVAVGLGAFVYSSKKNTSPTATPVESTTTTSETIGSTIHADSYKDGTYTAVGTYTSPAGPEEIDVKLTVKDNVVTDAEVTPKATNPKSKFMQGAFAGGYKEFVIGKKVNDITLTKVSGSSLTPMGFNAALEKIKSEAQAI